MFWSPRTRPGGTARASATGGAWRPGLSYIWLTVLYMALTVLYFDCLIFVLKQGGHLGRNRVKRRGFLRREGGRVREGRKEDVKSVETVRISTI